MDRIHLYHVCAAAETPSPPMHISSCRGVRKNCVRNFRRFSQFSRVSTIVSAVPRLADEPAALVIIIRVSRSHLERFGEVEFLNEFVLTSQKAAFRTEFEARAFGGRELRSRLGGTTCQASL